MTARKKRAPKKEENGLKKMTDTANAMAEAVTSTVEVSGDRVVDIYKCKAKNIGVILEAVGFIFEELNIKNLGEAPSIDLQNPAVLLPLIAKSSGRLLFIASELCSLDHDDVLELELDEVIEVMKKVFEVNQGFFLQSVLPQVQFLFQEQQAKSTR